MTESTPCTECGHPTVPPSVWRRMESPRPARSRYGPTGQCGDCRRRELHPTEPSDSRGVSREVVLEDWNWLHETGQLDPLDSLKHRVELAAPRMGMTVDSLQQALRRAGIRNPVGPGLQRAGRGEQCLECRKGQSALHRAEAEHTMVARRLAEHPHSARLRAGLAAAEAELVKVQLHRDWHLDAEHAETERTAA